ncbi:MAG: hypothetical protein OXG98_13860 [Gemmatimonadetes bacterium]|nr:hypothetical protein [Gemmatimonadota bacterium]
MSEERQVSGEQHDVETRSVNEDSPGIETMPDITPEMISPNPPPSNGENSQSDQSGSVNVESD